MILGVHTKMILVHTKMIFWETRPIQKKPSGKRPEGFIINRPPDPHQIR